ncbi:cell division protein FtsZ [Candidatus Woesearchaeota archaeon]|nr:cell division protein FtsZ [Candidatus Woesearchaeota archaeon]
MDFLVNSALQNAPQGTQQSYDPVETKAACIKVIGAGGSGNNMVNWLYQKGISGAEILACNTDQQHLATIKADQKFLIGKDVTRGLGCGGFPEKGAQAAQESLSQLKQVLRGSDMVFVCAGMGGGTGTGSAPIIAELARSLGAIVISTVTMPFSIERARVEKAEWGLKQLQRTSDTVIVIDNNRLVKIAGNLPIKQAFAVANELVATMIKGIVETIAIPSLVNLDYADVKAIMKDGGIAAIGVGFSDTQNKVDEAVKGAITNPLLDVSFAGATGALIHVCGGPDLKLDEINKIGEMITASMDEDANVIWGARIEESMMGKVTVMTIVTGVQSPWGEKPLVNAPAAKERFTQEKEVLSEGEDELGIEVLHS